MATKKEIQKYVDLPWSYNIVPEDDYYVVYVNELQGVATDGKTVEEAFKNIKEAIYCAVEGMLDAGVKIPVPINENKYKGKISYRTSAKRHYNIARIAQRKHVSLSKALDLLVDEGIEHISSVV